MTLLTDKSSKALLIPSQELEVSPYLLGALAGRRRRFWLYLETDLRCLTPGGRTT